MKVTRKAIASLEFFEDAGLNNLDRMRPVDAIRSMSRNVKHNRRNVERHEAEENAFRALVSADRREARCAGNVLDVGGGCSRLEQMCRSGLLDAGKIAMRQSQAEVEQVHELTDLDTAANRERRIMM